jgi:hypothetical protein
MIMIVGCQNLKEEHKHLLDLKKNYQYKILTIMNKIMLFPMEMQVLAVKDQELKL